MEQACARFGTDWPGAPQNRFADHVRGTTRATLDGRTPGGGSGAEAVVTEAIEALYLDTHYARVQEHRKAQLNPEKLAECADSARMC